MRSSHDRLRSVLLDTSTAECPFRVGEKCAEQGQWPSGDGDPVNRRQAAIRFTDELVVVGREYETDARPPCRVEGGSPVRTLLSVVSTSRGRFVEPPPAVPGSLFR